MSGRIKVAEYYTRITPQDYIMVPVVGKQAHCARCHKKSRYVQISCSEYLHVWYENIAKMYGEVTSTGKARRKSPKAQQCKDWERTYCTSVSCLDSYDHADFILVADIEELE